MLSYIHLWETDFYTPPVLGAAALLPFSAQEKILRELFFVRIHAGPVRVRIQENIPGELFMYWFRARGYAGLANPVTLPLTAVIVL